MKQICIDAFGASVGVLIVFCFGASHLHAQDVEEQLLEQYVRSNTGVHDFNDLPEAREQRRLVLENAELYLPMVEQKLFAAENPDRVLALIGLARRLSREEGVDDSWIREISNSILEGRRNVAQDAKGHVLNAVTHMFAQTAEHSDVEYLVSMIGHTNRQVRGVVLDALEKVARPEDIPKIERAVADMPPLEPDPRLIKLEGFTAEEMADILVAQEEETRKHAAMVVEAIQKKYSEGADVVALKSENGARKDALLGDDSDLVAGPFSAEERSDSEGATNSTATRWSGFIVFSVLLISGIIWLRVRRR